jgi:hypothetical protein
MDAKNIEPARLGPRHTDTKPMHHITAAASQPSSTYFRKTTMNFNLIRASTLALTALATAGAFAQSTERRVFVQPHVLEAKGSVCASRDAASGQATGRRSSDMHLHIDDKTRAATACDSTQPSSSPQDVRESPTLQSSKHTKTGHVTLLK